MLGRDTSHLPQQGEDGSMQLPFVRLALGACHCPYQGVCAAAGYDLYSAYDSTTPATEKTLEEAGVLTAFPSGCCGRAAPRSGVAAKLFIDVGAGVIGEGYRGNTGVVLFSSGEERFEVNMGGRIAQLICEWIFYPEIEQVQVLDDTEKGAGGFGSTGKN